MPNEKSVDNTLLSNGVLIDDKFYPKKNLPLGTLRIILTTACNFKCLYCFNEGEADKELRVQLLEKLKKVIKVSKTFGINSIKLTGGEPLMHPDILEIIKMSRIILPSTHIVIVTNGLLIPKLNEKILKSISDNDIKISLSLYKPTASILNVILDILKKYNIEYLINDNYYNKPEIINTFETRLTADNTNNGDLTSKICTGRFCRFLRDGKIAKCYYPLLIYILNDKYNMDLKLSREDYIDIYSIKDGWDAIDYLNKPIPFCDYCSEELYRFDWQGYCKNTDDISGFILKKVL